MVDGGGAPVHNEHESLRRGEFCFEGTIQFKCLGLEGTWAIIL